MKEWRRIKINTNNQNFKSLELIFERTLNVGLLSEKLLTCGLEDNAMDILNIMKNNDFDVFGVENETEEIIGYIEKDNISEGKVENQYNNFDPSELISEATPLLKLIEVLSNKNRVFVLENNTIEKIVTIADLHKQPMRMLIFSFISLLEMQLTAIIRETFPDDSWQKKLSERRLILAMELNRSRAESNEALTLLESTQLCDKGTIVKKSEALRKKLGFESNNKCESFFEQLEILRNNTAHSQSSLYTNNQDLIGLVIKIKAMLETMQSSKMSH